MTPGDLDLEVRQGDSYAMDVALSNADPSDPRGLTPGTPIDLTGCEAEMQIRDAFDVVQLSLSSVTATANGSGLTLGGTAGTVVISLVPADTAVLTSGVYDLRIKFSSGEIETWAAGRVDVTKGVTEWS